MPGLTTSPDYRLSPPSSRSTESPLTCSRTDEYTFCAPKKPGGDFYIALPPDPTSKLSHDVVQIQTWFKKKGSGPKQVEVPPTAIDVPDHSRVYQVTDLLPAIVANKNATFDKVGPNCYHAALAAAGYSHLGERYVDAKEFGYYLTRDWAPIWCGAANRYGYIVIYNDTTSADYDVGDHAAFSLLGALVFQKGGWAKNYPYEVVTIDGAMRAIDKYWVPRGEERFTGRPKRDYDKFIRRCYRKRTRPLQRTTSSKPKDRNWYLPLFKYYSHRVKRASRLKWSEFRHRRIDLLTVENMNRILDHFSERVGNMNPKNVLLSIDDDVAQAYLELYSLSWQYDAMVKTYVPLQKGQERRQLEEIYRKQYVRFDRDFYQELRLHLKLRGVPQKHWRAVEQRVVAKIRTYNPADYAKYNGAKGIPYFDILDEAIKAVTKAE